MEPSQLGSLKGLMRDKEHEGYTGSAPYGEGKSLRPVEMVLIRVTITRELNLLCPALDEIVLVPKPLPGRPFI